VSDILTIHKQQKNEYYTDYIILVQSLGTQERGERGQAGENAGADEPDGGTDFATDPVAVQEIIVTDVKTQYSVCLPQLKALIL